MASREKVLPPTKSCQGSAAGHGGEPIIFSSLCDAARRAPARGARAHFGCGDPTSLRGRVSTPRRRNCHPADRRQMPQPARSSHSSL